MTEQSLAWRSKRPVYRENIDWQWLPFFLGTDEDLFVTNDCKKTYDFRFQSSLGIHYSTGKDKSARIYYFPESEISKWKLTIVEKEDFPMDSCDIFHFTPTELARNLGRMFKVLERYEHVSSKDNGEKDWETLDVNVRWSDCTEKVRIPIFWFDSRESAEKYKKDIIREFEDKGIGMAC